MIVKAVVKMINTKSKLILSLLLIAASLFLLTYHYYNRGATQIRNDKTQIDNDVQISLKDTFVSNTLSDSIQKAAGNEILPVFIISPKVCSPCVNNVFDYDGLFKEENKFFEPILLFSDEEEETIKRFILTTGLDIPYEIFKSKDVDSFFNNLDQHLIL